MQCGSVSVTKKSASRCGLPAVVRCVAVCCSVLWCVAVCLCGGASPVLAQHTCSIAVYCIVLQCDAACCSVLTCVAVCCSVLQCVCEEQLCQLLRHTHRVAECGSVMYCAAVCCIVSMRRSTTQLLQHTCRVAVCCRMLHCDAAWCNVLQGVAGCCSMSEEGTSACSCGMPVVLQ